MYFFDHNVHSIEHRWRWQWQCEWDWAVRTKYVWRAEVYSTGLSQDIGIFVPIAAIACIRLFVHGRGFFFFFLLTICNCALFVFIYIFLLPSAHIEIPLRIFCAIKKREENY